jgi:hypothetical protein
VGTRKVSEQIMVFITAVTSVTKIKRYPSGLTLEAQNKTHVYPYRYRPRPPPKVVTEVTVMTLMPVNAGLL